MLRAYKISYSVTALHWRRRVAKYLLFYYPGNSFPLFSLPLLVLVVPPTFSFTLISVFVPISISPLSFLRSIFSLLPSSLPFFPFLYCVCLSSIYQYLSILTAQSLSLISTSPPSSLFIRPLPTSLSLSFSDSLTAPPPPPPPPSPVAVV